MVFLSPPWGGPDYLDGDNTRQQMHPTALLSSQILARPSKYRAVDGVERALLSLC